MKSLYKSCLILIACVTFYSKTFAQDIDVPYVSTPHRIVEAMLNMANVGPDDYVIDLGSGDGRIVIAAAKRGAFAIGVDIDPEMVAEANKNAETEGVLDKVMFFEQNIFDVDMSKASVVTMYLLNTINIKLKPTLFEQLSPGTRVVSHRFHMGNWEPDDKRLVEYLYVDIFPYDYANREWRFDPDELDITSEDMGEELKQWEENIKEFVEYAIVYFWVIPANFRGIWTWSIDEETFNMNVEQQFQEIDIEIRIGKIILEVYNPIANGERISFSAYEKNSQTHYAFSGRIDGGQIDGSVLIRSKSYSRVEHWDARLME